MSRAARINGAYTLSVKDGITEIVLDDAANLIDASGIFSSGTAGAQPAPSTTTDVRPIEAGFPTMIATPEPPASPEPQSVEAFALYTQPMTRHGHLYNGRLQRRVGILQDDDLVYKYPTYAALVAAVAPYDGTVRAVLPDRTIRTLKRSITQPLPIDYYLWQGDGSMVRCDQHGQVTAELENMKPADQGALATGGTGPGDTDVPIRQD